MPVVSEIRKQGRSVEVEFDDGSILRCDRSFSLASSLAVGQAIDGAILGRLSEEALRHDASTSAKRWLSARPRSRVDIARRLNRRGIPETIVEETLAEMERRGLLNDRAYARLWADGRTLSRPRSSRMVRSELIAQGVDGALATEAVEEIDDNANALTLARKRARHFQGEYAVYQRRTSAALIRRGFSHEIVRSAMQTAWDERDDD